MESSIKGSQDNQSNVIPISKQWLEQIFKENLSERQGDNGDYKLVGYSVQGDLNAQQLNVARLALEKSIAPAKTDELKSELMRLQLLTMARQLGENERALQYTAFGEELKKYPADLVRDALRMWPTKSKFFPAFQEVLELIEPEFKIRLMKLEAVDQAIKNLNVKKISQSDNHSNLINVKASFRASHGNVMANTWIEKLRFVSRTDNTIKIQAESAFHKDWIKNKYLDDILFFWKKNDNSVEKLEVVL